MSPARRPPPPVGMLLADEDLTIVVQLIHGLQTQQRPRFTPAQWDRLDAIKRRGAQLLISAGGSGFPAAERHPDGPAASWASVDEVAVRVGLTARRVRQLLETWPDPDQVRKTAGGAWQAHPDVIDQIATRRRQSA